ncbi:MAG: YfhO family protein [Saprospiraceae bacterium]
MFSKKAIIQHIVAILAIVLVNVIYFYPQLQGKVLEQGDIVSSDQATTALIDYGKKNNTTYLWNPSQFGGTPILAGPPSYNNQIYKAYNILKLGFNEPIGMFIAGALMTYLMLILLGINGWLSMFLAIAMVLTTSNVILWEAGHNSKIRTLIFTPLLIAGVLSIFENRKYLLGFSLLSFGFGLSFYTRHPQMTYYILLVFLVYGIVVLVDTIKNKDWTHFAKGTLLVLGAVTLGASTSATKLWSLYDYSKVTMRGESILKGENTNGASSSEVDGLAWEYAMQWSNDTKDLIATYIPGFVGGGSGEKVGKKSESYKKYKIKTAPLYWGNLPFTVGPMYLGASLLFLFVFGLFVVKGNVKWWLGLGAVWMAILSMGRNAEIINKLIFDIFPFYSKFRAPQSVLNIAPFFIGILGAVGLNQFIKIKFNSKKYKIRNQKKYTKPLLISYAICGGLALIIALIGPSLFDFNAPGDARYTQQGTDISAFINDRKSLMRSDAFRTFLIVSLIAGLMYGYIKLKVNKSIAIAGIGLIILFDMIGVDWRYLDHGKYMNKSQYNQNFTERPVDQQIKRQEPRRELYRIHDLTINTFNSSEASAQHNTIGGYDPAKMQRMQDLIDRHITRNNMQVLNMMNTKYLVVQGQNNQPTVQLNSGALGTAWFVSNVQKVSTPNDEINALSTINTANTAVILNSEFGDYTTGLISGIDTTATINLSTYEPDKMTYTTNSNKEMMAVFSEMWYGPNKGWQAYIDGNKVDHIRANYALRAMRIPSGSHEIVFEFMPRPYYMGEKISLISSILMLLAFAGYLVYEYRNSVKEKESEL